MIKLNKFPDAVTIILSIMVVFILLTWIIPAGEFERQLIDGRSTVVPGSYQSVEQAPRGLTALFIAPFKGFLGSASIIAFVFMVGGAFSILTKTGAIDAGLQHVIKIGSSNPASRKWIVILLFILFSFAGATFGMSEEVLIFILITIPLGIALGYDSITGVAISFVGAGVGFAGAFLNPFTIGIAQGIAELPPFSGMQYRLIVWCVMTLVGILFLLYYLNRIESNPSSSLVYEIDQKRDLTKLNSVDEIQLTGRRKALLLLLLITLISLFIGASHYGWYIEEITALFLALGFLAALIGRITTDEAIEAFKNGMKEMITPVLVIALAKALIVIATDGKIIDTLLQFIASSSQGLPKVVSVEIMFVLQSLLNFFVPSGSGQAALTMPIMAPLSDLLGVSRQTAVLAFQFGDGLTNMIIPTSGITMGVLAISGIPYNKWIRWMLPLFLILFIVSMVLLAIPILFMSGRILTMKFMRYLIVFCLFITSCHPLEKHDVRSSLMDQVLPQGTLFIIGGGKRPASLVQKLIDESSLDSSGYAVILPMSSSEPDTASFYAIKQFTDLGVAAEKFMSFYIDSLNVRPSQIDSIKEATLIYLTGGDQRRFISCIEKTQVADAIKSAYQRGATVAGTSAGAALMSQKMMTGDEFKHPKYTGDFRTIEVDNIETVEGLGLLSQTIVDQHFIYRMRMNRLISVAIEHPEELAVGIDESTAIIVKNGKATIAGLGQVIVLDNQSKQVRTQSGMLGADSLQLKVFLPGDSFDIN